MCTSSKLQNTENCDQHSLVSNFACTSRIFVKFCTDFHRFRMPFCAPLCTLMLIKKETEIECDNQLNHWSNEKERCHDIRPKNNQEWKYQS